MYKRRARLLFVAQERELLHLAEQQVGGFADGWMECETLRLAAGQPVPDEQLSSADLLVSLHREATPAAVYFGKRPYRRWHVPGDINEAEQFLRTRVESMVAGMKMLSRMDPQDEA